MIIVKDWYFFTMYNLIVDIYIEEAVIIEISMTSKGLYSELPIKTYEFMLKITQ